MSCAKYEDYLLLVKEGSGGNYVEMRRDYGFHNEIAKHTRSWFHNPTFHRPKWPCKIGPMNSVSRYYALALLERKKERK